MCLDPACSVSGTGFELLIPHSQVASRTLEAAGNLPVEISPSLMVTSHQVMVSHTGGQIFVVNPSRMEATRATCSQSTEGGHAFLIFRTDIC